MEYPRPSLIVFITIVLVIISLKSHARTNEAEALVNFYREKLFSGIDRSNGLDFVSQEGLGDSSTSRDFSQQNLKENDKILRLPGQPDVDFDQYSGYVTVDASKGRALFYYFVEANSKDKESLPLLLWLNGGPGCSSLAFGAMQELGPFRVKSDGKTLFNNIYAWNKVANVLFLESPSGVGFSYSNTTSDTEKNGDRATAADNYWFLRNWFQTFPEYINRDFYISGESYAGHYVPQLAHFVLSMNKLTVNHDNIINLKGIIIGNAVINDETDNQGTFNHMWTHALISDQLHKQIQTYCDFSSNAQNSATCNESLSLALNQTLNVLDLYNIYLSLCHSHGVTHSPKHASVYNFDPCNDNYVHAYLNTPEVQKALHASVTKLKYDSESCANITWTDSATISVVPLLREFMANGLRVWIFSGDTDGVVPVTATRYSIDSMNLTTKTAWYPWFIDGEVGGYTQVYNGEITFATVIGAGHQVPTYRPRRALALITDFLSGSPLPTH